MNKIVREIFQNYQKVSDNLIIVEERSADENQQQTNDAFSDKWLKYDINATINSMESFQLDWYLKLYGFNSEDGLKNF